VARRERDDTSTQLEVSRADVDLLKATEELRELFIGVLAHDLTTPWVQSFRRLISC
jgi:hypothetical protein